MNIMKFIIIGNIFSFFAAIFTITTSLGRTREQIYYRQFAQCALLAIANVFFMSWSGVVTMILNSTRNILLLKDKFNKYMCALYIILIMVIGMYCNNRGLVGLIPIYCSIRYTIVSMLVRKPISIKVNIITNLIFWCIYELYIHDFPSAVVDVVTITVTLISIYKMKKSGTPE